jgi:hypothetical protein
MTTRCRGWRTAFQEGLLEEELLGDDLAVFDVVHGHFVHLHATLTFDRHVHAHGAGKVIARNDRCTRIAAMHFLSHVMPSFAFFDDLVQTLHSLPRSMLGLDALGILAEQFTQNLIELAFLGQFIEAIRNLLCRHCEIDLNVITEANLQRNRSLQIKLTQMQK